LNLTSTGTFTFFFASNWTVFFAIVPPIRTSSASRVVSAPRLH
jgi:hypothetical protein